MDLYQILGIIKKHLILIVIILFLFSSVSVIYSYFFTTPMYRATTTLIVGRAHQEDGIGPDYSDLLAYQMLVKTYVEIAKSEGVAKKTVENLYLDLPPAAVQGMISATPAGDTEIMYLSITDTSAERAARIANGASRAFLDRAKELISGNNIQIIDEAKVPGGPFKPNKRLNVLIGTFLGLMAALGLVFLLEYMDSTIKGIDDLENTLELPVIGVIPVIK